MSCHLVVGDLSQGPSRLSQARALLKNNFGIDHVTIQVEDEALSSEVTLCMSEQRGFAAPAS